MVIQIALTILKCKPASLSNQNFRYKEVELKTVLILLGQLSSSHAEDVFNLYSSIMKHAIRVILMPLPYLINLAPTAGTFPESY